MDDKCTSCYWLLNTYLFLSFEMDLEIDLVTYVMYVKTTCEHDLHRSR